MSRDLSRKNELLSMVRDKIMAVSSGCQVPFCGIAGLAQQPRLRALTTAWVRLLTHFELVEDVTDMAFYRVHP